MVMLVLTGAFVQGFKIGVEGPMVAGPDPYGYIAVGSNETDTLAPTYNWVDKSSDPATVHLTMSDDDIQGPFSIGFDFPFYWYTVNEFYVVSNGAITFNFGEAWTAHDNFIPNTAPPNNLVVGLGADLNPECSGSRIYYWTNNTDSLVVTFENVPTWRLGTNCEGSHTFQMILTSDGNITFQYGPQTGGYDYGIGQTNISIGIESLLGNPGLSIYEDTGPATYAPTNGLAIRIYRPDSSTFTISDVSAYRILPDRTTDNMGVFTYVQQTNFVPTVAVRNTGTDTLYNTNVVLMLRRWYNGTSVYTSSRTVDTLVPGQVKSIPMDPVDFSTLVPDVYSFHLVVTNSSDGFTGNNRQYLEVRLKNASQPDTFYWFNWSILTGTISVTSWLGAGGGWAQRFDPGGYPFRIDSVWYIVAGCTGCTYNIQMPAFVATDSAGQLGRWLAADTIPVTPDSLKIYTLVTPGLTVDSAFYVGFIQTDTGGPKVAVDTSMPISRQTYESTNGTVWTPYRDRETSDFLFVVWGQVLGTDVSERPIKPVPPYSLTDEKVVFPRSTYVEVYSSDGRLILKGYFKEVDFSRLARGVYFLLVDRADPKRFVVR